MPRCTYYKYFNQIISNRDRENDQLTKITIKIHQDSRMRYDAPKIHHLLNQEGHQAP